MAPWAWLFTALSGGGLCMPGHMHAVSQSKPFSEEHSYSNVCYVPAQSHDNVGMLSHMHVVSRHYPMMVRAHWFTQKPCPHAFAWWHWQACSHQCQVLVTSHCHTDTSFHVLAPSQHVVDTPVYTYVASQHCHMVKPEFLFTNVLCPS